MLEHIEDPKSFLQEISRVVRKRTLFSVPNIEVIPYFKDWQAVPWSSGQRSGGLPEAVSSVR